MSYIFPGVDPYLEEPQIWQGLHNTFVVYVRDHLRPLIAPRYIAAVEERVFVEGPQRDVIPDLWIHEKPSPPQHGNVAVLETDAPVVVQVPSLEIHEAYITILDRHSGQRIVTVIEVTSPTNKAPGPGRQSYMAKQKEVRNSETHLVEIDLLRAGHHVLAVPQWVAEARGRYNYLMCVNRAEGMRDTFDLYLRELRQRLPKIRIPLATGDPDVPLDLQAVLAYTYENGSYRDRLRYEKPCVPPLRAEDQAWADELTRSAVFSTNGNKLATASSPSPSSPQTP